MLRGKEGEEIKNIIKNNKYYIFTKFFLFSKVL